MEKYQPSDSGTLYKIFNKTSSAIIHKFKMPYSQIQLTYANNVYGNYFVPIPSSSQFSSRALYIPFLYNTDIAEKYITQSIVCNERVLIGI